MYSDLGEKFTPTLLLNDMHKIAPRCNIMVHCKIIIYGTMLKDNRWFVYGFAILLYSIIRLFDGNDVNVWYLHCTCYQQILN